LNVDKEDVTNTERLVGEIDKNMTVTCQANGGNPAPDVTIVFDDDATNAPAIGPVTIIKEMTEENTYQGIYSQSLMNILYHIESPKKTKHCVHYS
jgi:hypothetical protein